MTYSCSVSDLVSRIKNGSLAKKDSILVPFSIIKGEIVKILKKEGFISSYTEIDNKSGKWFLLRLKYYDLNPVINEISVVSKPGKRVYCSAKDLPIIKNDLGLTILSTSAGIVTGNYARDRNLGGEILLQIF